MSIFFKYPIYDMHTDNRPFMSFLVALLSTQLIDVILIIEYI